MNEFSRRRSMPGVRWAGLVGIAGLLAAGCNTAPAVLDRTAFCADIESGVAVAGAGRTLVSGVAYVTYEGEVTRTFSNVDITLDVVGGLERDPDYDLRLCPGDCIFAGDEAFSRRARVRTDDDGVYVFTVQAGARAGGFVLLDFGTVTCRALVGVGAPSGGPGTPEPPDEEETGPPPERPDVMTNDGGAGGL